MPTSNEPSILPHNQQAAKVWSAGGADYERISCQIQDAIDHCVDRLAPKLGERVLDVATGTGFTARRVKARGVEVIGSDIAEDKLAAAREFAPDIEFLTGDAEALPFADAEFDAVISTFGVMFASDPEKAASELARVCKPGGRVALATWQTKGGLADMFQVIKRYLPPSPTPKPSPFAWGDLDRLRELLSPSFDLAFERGVSLYREPNAASAWEAFAIGYGPTRTLISNLDEAAVESFRREFEAYHDEHRTDLGILVERPYVITVGTRRS